ncbi:Bifunctional nitrilase/nitrile hydratase NIT4 [Linum grandiflorum]
METDAEEQLPATESQSAVDPYNRICISESCYEAISILKSELRLERHYDVVPWLLEQLRLQTAIGNSGVPTCNSLASTSQLPTEEIFVPRPIPPPRLQWTRVTVAQASTVFFDTRATLEKAEKLISVAAASSCRLIVFPEAFIGGYPRFLLSESSSAGEELKMNDDVLKKYRDSAIEYPGEELHLSAFVLLPALDWKYGINVVIGVVERSGSKLFSTVIFFDWLGRHLGRHRKMSIKFPSEASTWSPGEMVSPLPLYETSSAGKIGGFISSDNLLPVFRNGLYENGIEVYCAPTVEADEAWNDSMTHIAMEGNCFVVSANQFVRRMDCCGPNVRNDGAASSSEDNAVVSAGGSVIISPSGEFLAKAKYHGEYVLVADLEFGEITTSKVEFGGDSTGFGPNDAGWTVDASAAADAGCSIQST